MYGAGLCFIFSFLRWFCIAVSVMFSICVLSECQFQCDCFILGVSCLLMVSMVSIIILFIDIISYR